MGKTQPKELEKIEKSNQESKEKYWKELDAENTKRARRGLPPKVFEEGGPGGTGPGVGRPSLTSAQTIEYIRAIAVELYGDKRKCRKFTR